MTKAARNPGERLFEEYLELYGYEFQHEKSPPGKRKRPDYPLSRDGIKVRCEVKDFEPKSFPEGEVTWDAYKGLREKINAAARQFKEYKDEVCCLVVFNQGDQYVDLDTPRVLLGAMYGDAGVSFPLRVKGAKPAGEPEPVFLERGKMLNPKTKAPQNTTISALITIHQVNVGLMNLRLYLAEHPEIGDEEMLGLTSERVGFDINEKRLGVIVWENVFAAKPLPRDVFNGPFDVRWGKVDAGQSIVHRGEKLPEGAVPSVA